jgi:hypothetical protein
MVPPGYYWCGTSSAMKCSALRWLSISCAAPSAFPASRQASSRRREPVIIPFATGPTVRIMSRMTRTWLLFGSVAAGLPAASASSWKISACAATFDSHLGLDGRQDARSTLSQGLQGQCGHSPTGDAGRRRLDPDQLLRRCPCRRPCLHCHAPVLRPANRFGPNGPGACGRTGVSDDGHPFRQAGTGSGPMGCHHPVHSG